MTDHMLKKEGFLHIGYSVYIWMCLFYAIENYISVMATVYLEKPELFGLPAWYLYKRICIFFLMIALMILIAHCAERFCRSNLFFPLTNMLLSGMSIILLLEHFIFAAGFSHGNETVIAANTFMALRLLLFVDSVILLKKYFRAKNENNNLIGKF